MLASGLGDLFIHDGSLIGDARANFYCAQIMFPKGLVSVEYGTELEEAGRALEHNIELACY